MPTRNKRSASNNRGGQTKRTSSKTSNSFLYIHRKSIAIFVIFGLVGSILAFSTYAATTQGGTVGPTKVTKPAVLPTPETTGYKHTGVTLKPCEQYESGGSYVIKGTAKGTVVDGCDFYGKQVRITGGGPVTLRRSLVRDNSSCDSACAAVYVAKGAGPVTIEDVEITTTNPAVTQESQRQDRSISIDKGNDLGVVIRRVYAHDTTRGVDITGEKNIIFHDSFLAFNMSPPSNGNCGQERKHSSAIRAAGKTSTVLFQNTVLGIGKCAFGSGLVALYPEQGANHDIVFQGGLWIIQGDNSGAYGVAVGYTPGKEKQNYNITVRDVQISTQYYAQGCPSGCAQNWTGDKAPGGTKIWENVTKYNPGKADHGQQMKP